MNRLLDQEREAIEELCRRFGVERLDVFGSALGQDFDVQESDFDFLVEFGPMEPYQRVDAYFGLLDQLRRLFHRKIDLVMVDAVKNPYIAEDIERTKQSLYAA